MNRIAVAKELVRLAKELTATSIVSLEWVSRGLSEVGTKQASTGRITTAGKILGPGIPDGTGPARGSGFCPFDEEGEEPVVSKRVAQHLENVKALEPLTDRETTRAIRDAIIAEEGAIEQELLDEGASEVDGSIGCQ